MVRMWQSLSWLMTLIIAARVVVFPDPVGPVIRINPLRSSIPYGPFLALVAVAWIFVGEYVPMWYAPLLGLTN